MGCSASPADCAMLGAAAYFGTGDSGVWSAWIAVAGACVVRATAARDPGLRRAVVVVDAAEVDVLRRTADSTRCCKRVRRDGARASAEGDEQGSEREMKGEAVHAGSCPAAASAFNAGLVREITPDPAASRKIVRGS